MFLFSDQAVLPFFSVHALAVHQSLAFYSLNSGKHSLTVINLTIVPTERKLIAVTEQVVFAQAVEYAVMSSLQQREKALGRVCVLAFSVHVIFRRVMHNAMTAAEFFIQAVAGAEFVGHNLRGRMTMLSNSAF